MPLTDPDAYAAVVADPSGSLLGLDFDGTLAHVVDDPSQAFVHPGSREAVARLGHVLGQVAIVTGRPVRQALELSGFEGLAGLENLVVCGQYGAERWDAATGDVTEPDRPEAVDRLADVLPGWLAERGAGHVRIEDKGLALAVHTRGIDHDLIDALAEPLADLAADLGLEVEPGRQVLEVRQPGSDKGRALTGLVHETSSRHVVYVGDDLGDLPAFRAVEVLRGEGVSGLLVCSASEEQDALVSLSDVVLDGPDAVAAWLTDLADAVEAAGAGA